MKKILMKTVQIYEQIIIRYTLPILWPLISKILRGVSKKTIFIEPKSYIFNEVVVFTNSNARPKKRSLNYDILAKNWARNSLKISKVHVKSQLQEHSPDTYILTNEWFKSKKQHLYFFIPAIHLALRIRKKKKPVWILIGDTYNLKIVIPASILVALCGGSIVLQQNTKVDGEKFGIVHVSGPHFWLFTSANLDDFKSDIRWEMRKKILVIAASGDLNRLKFLEKNRDKLETLNYDIIETKHQYNWQQYRKILKDSRVNINSSLLQEHVIRQNYWIKRKLSKFTVTNRVWEGFCSGALVLTDDNPVLQFYGFKPNKHFLDLEEIEKSNFDLPDELTSARIAESGRKKFMLDVVKV